MTHPRSPGQAIWCLCFLVALSSSSSSSSMAAHCKKCLFHPINTKSGISPLCPINKTMAWDCAARQDALRRILNGTFAFLATGVSIWRFQSLWEIWWFLKRLESWGQMNAGSFFAASFSGSRISWHLLAPPLLTRPAVQARVARILPHVGGSLPKRFPSLFLGLL